MNVRGYWPSVQDSEHCGKCVSPFFKGSWSTDRYNSDLNPLNVREGFNSISPFRPPTLPYSVCGQPVNNAQYSIEGGGGGAIL